MVDHMRILVDVPNRGQRARYFLGDNDRLATATSCVWVAPDRLVAAHLAGQAMALYAVDFAAGRAEELHRIDTTHMGQPACTDLMDFDGRDHLLVSNFDQGTASSYRLAEDRLIHELDFPLMGKGFHCHGARFFRDGMSCITTEQTPFFVCANDTGRPIARFDLGLHLKDLLFLPGDRAIGAFALGAPHPSVSSPYCSGLVLFKINLGAGRASILDRIDIFPCAFDAIVHDPVSDRLLITDQFGNRVVVASLRAGRLQVEGQINGYDFPHGIDIAHGVLAVTNYGNSEVWLSQMDTLPITPLQGSWQRQSLQFARRIKRRIAAYRRGRPGQ